MSVPLSPKATMFPRISSSVTIVWLPMVALPPFANATNGAAASVAVVEKVARSSAESAVASPRSCSSGTRSVSPSRTEIVSRVVGPKFSVTASLVPPPERPTPAVTAVMSPEVSVIDSYPIMGASLHK